MDVFWHLTLAEDTHCGKQPDERRDKQHDFVPDTTTAQKDHRVRQIITLSLCVAALNLCSSIWIRFIGDSCLRGRNQLLPARVSQPTVDLDQTNARPIPALPLSSRQKCRSVVAASASTIHQKTSKQLKMESFLFRFHGTDSSIVHD
jgi:hypothetical protein